MALCCHPKQHFLRTGSIRQKQTLDGETLSRLGTGVGGQLEQNIIWLLCFFTPSACYHPCWRQGSCQLGSPLDSHTSCYLVVLATSWTAGITVAAWAYASACCCLWLKQICSASDKCCGYIEYMFYVKIWNLFSSKMWFSVSISVVREEKVRHLF